ncbi:emerin [Elgaria multicarinata webbii]|uniref:emerin n=1 Tax=Elgaria multicarinata webbii TaxID=159646 RepID=UPI002FCD5E77
MDEYKGLTDNELIARLKKYSIPHGPLVGSTRKLYEKKVYEYETERTQLPSPGGSVSYTEPCSESYMRETFVSPRSREDLSYGREALGSTRTFLRENYDSPRKEEFYSEYGNEALGSSTRTYLRENYDSPKEEYYSEYGNEDPSPTKSYLGHNYGLTHHEEQSTYKPEDWGVNSPEGSTSSYRRYVSSLSSGTSPGSVSARQPIAEPYPYSSGRKDVPTNRDSSSYQSIFYQKSPGSSSLGVEPRRAIHPERQAQAAENATGSNGGTKRYLPLWPQLLLFMLLAGFLAFIYYFLQGGADDNPFVKHLKQ